MKECRLSGTVKERISNYSLHLVQANKEAAPKVRNTTVKPFKKPTVEPSQKADNHPQLYLANRMLITSHTLIKLSNKNIPSQDFLNF